MLAAVSISETHNEKPATGAIAPGYLRWSRPTLPPPDRSTAPNQTAPNQKVIAMRRSVRATAAFIVLLAVSTSAQAGVRNFFTPALDGTRLDACLSGGVCGKPAADAFCKSQGYDKALIFQREAFQSTRTLDSDQTCSSSCIAFKQIKCFTTKTDFAGLEQQAD